MKKLKETTIEGQPEIENKQIDTEQEQHVMLLTPERVLIRIGDRARVQTDREAVATIAKINIVRMKKEMTKTEGAQTGAIKVH